MIRIVGDDEIKNDECTEKFKDKKILHHPKIKGRETKREKDQQPKALWIAEGPQHQEPREKKEGDDNEEMTVKKCP